MNAQTCLIMVVAAFMVGCAVGRLFRAANPMVQRAYRIAKGEIVQCPRCDRRDLLTGVGIEIVQRQAKLRGRQHPFFPEQP